MKYKIGDRIKIKEDLHTDEDYGTHRFIKGMEKCKGLFVTISSFDTRYGTPVGYFTEETEDWIFTDGMIEFKVEESCTELPKETLLTNEAEIAMKNFKSVQKPPIGVMPNRIYEMNRIRDLTRALYEYAQYDIKNNTAIMLEWVEELTLRLECLDDLTEGD